MKNNFYFSSNLSTIVIHEQAMKFWNQIIYSTSAADRPERLSIGDDPPIDGLILDIKIVEFASLFLRPIL